MIYLNLNKQSIKISLKKNIIYNLKISYPMKNMILNKTKQETKNI